MQGGVCKGVGGRVGEGGLMRASESAEYSCICVDLWDYGNENRGRVIGSACSATKDTDLTILKASAGDEEIYLQILPTQICKEKWLGSIAFR